MSDAIATHERRRNGIPAGRRASGPLPKRIVTNPWVWVFLVFTALYAACLWWQYDVTTRPIQVPGGEIDAMNFSAIRQAAGLAWPTLAFWIVLYLALDRFRPQRPLFWWLALGWGAAVSTAASMVINTWAASMLGVAGDGDPVQAARAAVFSAPFVEEATKASVLFLIAIAVRYQLVSKVTGVVLGGLSAAGFAFTENIIYYARVIVFSSMQIGAGDPEEALAEIVRLRGLLLAFGHPLFTTMTAIGVIVAVRTHSKVVRVLAPLAGYLAAALLHMMFNFFASQPIEQSRWAYFFLALPLLLAVAFYVGRQLFGEGRRLRTRLADYVRVGWLPETDAEVAGRWWLRFRAGLVALTYGWGTFVATLRLQRALTELGYLRDAMVRGIVDAAGDRRARELIDRVEGLRGTAIDDPRGKRLNLPRLGRFRPRRRRRVAETQPFAPVNSPSAPVGSYSPVDPRWGPPS